MKWTRYLLLFLCILLCQCTSQINILQTPTIPPQNRQSNTTLAAWELTGLMGAKTPQKAWSAQLSWIQNGPQQYHIHLTGPLGGGSVQIQRAYQTVTYKDEHHIIQAKSASRLFKQQTGIALPVEYLYYWVRGVPAKAPIQAKVYDAQHQLITLKQAGYTIHYSDYQPFGAYLLPTKIRLESTALLVKMVIKSWKV